MLYRSLKGLNVWEYSCNWQIYKPIYIKLRGAALAPRPPPVQAGGEVREAPDPPPRKRTTTAPEPTKKKPAGRVAKPKAKGKQGKRKQKRAPKPVKDNYACVSCLHAVCRCIDCKNTK